MRAWLKNALMVVLFALVVMKAFLVGTVNPDSHTVYGE